ncbi:hypothetical protein TRIUR3_11485 [Triticum urartu]|uniref:Uncharacterized protein n=2 Tax=Triticum TaxID=4564 RepID=A0A9R0SBE3_TRITD|nr:hypothetical protein TRIUR3_11485 [Triticum urartu]VAH91094.1 unnamed protein product [Triticum turgidum subsp. durum]
MGWGLERYRQQPQAVACSGLLIYIMWNAWIEKPPHLQRCIAFSSEDWEIAESTLQFWCSLAHCILGIDEQTSKRSATQELFLPVFSSLLDALLFRAQIIDIDEHCTGRVSSIPDGLVQFRLNLEELLVDICLLLGAPAYINKIMCPAHGCSFIEPVLIPY